MTIKHRYLAEPNDLLSITLTCRECMASVTLPIDKASRLPGTCPSCNEGCFRRDTNEKNAITEVLERLTELKGRGPDAPGQIHFEIRPPNDQPSDKKYS